MNTIDYSHTWTEQRDRGGLYHVNNNFFALTKAIELVCRQHLDVRTDPSDVILSKIEEDVLKTEDVIPLWETMMDLLKPEYIHFPYHGQVSSFNSHRKATWKTIKQYGTEM